MSCHVVIAVCKAKEKVNQFVNRKEEDNKVSIDGKTGRDILEKEKWSAEHSFCRHTYLAEGLTVIKEAVPLGRGCSIALRDG